MAKNRVLFDKATGQVIGVLDKHEMEDFKEQRNIDDFHIVKMKDDELGDAFQYKNEADYFPIYVEDFIIFPHEEISCCEIIQNNCQQFHLKLPAMVNSILETIRFTPDEEMLVKVYLGTMMNVVQQIDNLDLDMTEGLDYREALIDTMRYFGLRREFK